MIKIVTGIRRCGKSYLLDPLFIDYLKKLGIDDSHIIKIELDREKNKKYLDREVLDKYIRSKCVDSKMYYIILDEIQLVDGFESVLNDFIYEKEVEEIKYMFTHYLLVNL